MGKEVENPCISECKLNSEMCTSCGRSREEIRKWRSMKRPEKLETVEKAAARLKSLKKKNKKKKKA
ncbi:MULTISPECIES: DUF1289 domain-containing protein [unclassified Pseudomonas]|uniref:DUF1289 domain-containing protein n=1 Tax=unclassified Pseudomonas TaxID=196821 RepID=UPI000BC40407|nr:MULTISPECIES: DUF1289 domain-containing protein [unclassified Pseudomonas]PVZ12483.1 putative Fe-S protein YdhL (DUF1289 family) [Pseudomonas sp. URIL14HWK12:I12]PVZ23365.1 putative Fe-S protein YdhL (DUF1289 family) [Pseudomonas sp. URIL14HWK12:I10]PVZ32695.1 putative Fe-S protein YdhL (DUF1289 family) [Pseudomonas sp. URIL14HWK12:I11]SNZ13849.1 Predicted Fe-S protein YdhL, DUF1289 family [Pseudomonas sp. URIL14HWK12:I9]